MQEYFDFKDCHYYHSNNGSKKIRCPECKECEEQIESRGDCKNLIKMPDGHIAQWDGYMQKNIK